MSTEHTFEYNLDTVDFADIPQEHKDLWNLEFAEVNRTTAYLYDVEKPLYNAVKRMYGNIRHFVAAMTGKHTNSRDIDDQVLSLAAGKRFCIVPRGALTEQLSQSLAVSVEQHTEANKPKCKSKSQCRMVLGIDTLELAKLDIVNLSLLDGSTTEGYMGILLDSMSQQLQTLESDCCTFDGVITHITDKMKSLATFCQKFSYERLNTMLSVMSSSRTPSWMPSVIYANRQPGNSSNSSVTPSQQHLLATTLRTRPVFPAITDLSSNGNIHKLVNHARELLNGNYDMEVDKWNDDVKMYLDFAFLANAPPNRALDYWKSLTPTNLVKELETLLPQNFAKNEKSLKTQLLEEVNGHHLKIDFYSKLMDQKQTFALGLANLQLQYKRANEADPYSNIEERALISALGKCTQFYSLCEASKTSLEQSIKESLKEETTFSAAMQKLLKLVLEKVDMLIIADSFRGTSKSAPPTYQQQVGNKRKEYSSSDKDDGWGKSWGQTSSSSGYKSFNKPTGSSKPANTAAQKPLIVCKGCGYNSKDGKCPRNGGAGCASDTRRNTTNLSWETSDTGKKWSQAGFNKLPGDATITLHNAVERKKAYQANNNHKGNYSYMWMINHCKNLMIKNELIPFSLPHVQVANLARVVSTSRAKKLRTESAPAGHLLLDTGAIGRSVVSESFFKFMSDNNQHSVIRSNMYLTN